VDKMCPRISANIDDYVRTRNKYVEEEEKVTWAIWPNCHGIGEEGCVCTNCEDMGMIYSIPLEDKGTNLQNHDNIDQELCCSSDKTPNSENNDDEEEEHGESQELGGTVHDWSQVNKVGNEEQKLDKWLIDSSAYALELWSKIKLASNIPTTALMNHIINTQGPIWVVSNASLNSQKLSAFSWMIATNTTKLLNGARTVPGTPRDSHSGRAEGFGLLTALTFLEHYVHHNPMLAHFHTQTI